MAVDPRRNSENRGSVDMIFELVYKRIHMLKRNHRKVMIGFVLYRNLSCRINRYIKSERKIRSRSLR